jgi:hypothetical protein
MSGIPGPGSHVGCRRGNGCDHFPQHPNQSEVGSVQHLIAIFLAAAAIQLQTRTYSGKSAADDATVLPEGVDQSSDAILEFGTTTSVRRQRKHVCLMPATKLTTIVVHHPSCDIYP